MRHVLAAVATVLIAGRVVTLSAFAADLAPRPVNSPAPNSLVPQSAFFVGLGGGLDSANFGNQNVFGKGTSFTPPTGGHVTPQIGSAQGSTGLDLDTHTALAPTIQAGYFQHFFGTPWMWGGKLTYSYLDIGSAKNDLLIPQSGGFTQDGVVYSVCRKLSLSSPTDRPLISKYRSFPSSADRLTEAIYIWEPVRPLRKPRHPLKVSPDLKRSLPFPQARPG